MSGRVITSRAGGFRFVLAKIRDRVDFWVWLFDANGRAPEGVFADGAVGPDGCTLMRSLHPMPIDDSERRAQFAGALGRVQMESRAMLGGRFVGG